MSNQCSSRQDQIPVTVLFCQPTLNESGSENSLLEILAGLQGLEPTLPLLVLAGQTGPMAECYERYAQVGVVAAPKLRRDWQSILPHLRSYWQVYQQIRKARAEHSDIVVYVNTLMFPQAVVGGWLSRLPVVVHIREVATTYPWVVYAAYYALAAVASRCLVAVCHYIFRQRVDRFLGQLVQRQREVVCNSSDFPIDAIEKRLDGERRILAVIPFTKRKGAFDLARFVVELKSTHPDLEFFLDVAGQIAEPELHQQALKLLQEAGCVDRVRFHGALQRETIAELYGNAHVLVHPSHTEAFPRILVEAMNHGLPCVATDVGGSAEAVQEGRTGYIVPMGDYRAMAGRVSTLLTCPELYAAMSEAVLERYTQLYTRTAMTEQVLRVIRAAASKGTPREGRGDVCSSD